MRIIQPTEELRPYVRYYWMLKSDEPFSVLTFPIGCPQIIFHRKTPLHIPELSSSQDPFTISGQVDFPTHISSDGNLDMIVAVFYPHTVGIFIDTPPSEFRNSEISGFDIGNKNLNVLARQILDCGDTDRCIALTESWLLSKLHQFRNQTDLKRIGAAVGTLLATPSVSVTELAGKACLSPKQFGRIFSNYVGMMPKEYSRIVRFQKSLWLLQNHHRDYAGIAYECGYSDQSHFIRDFRHFCGLTPRELTEYQTPYSDLYSTPV